MSRTPRQIVDDCNELAMAFYSMHGYEVPPDYKMYKATHPQERGMWNMAVYAYDYIEGTEVQSALDDLEES